MFPGPSARGCDPRPMRRVSRLLYRPILSSDSDDARAGKAPGQLAAALESSDLGRRLIFRLRGGIPWSDRSRQVTAADVARALIDRSDPNSAKFQARWADLLDRVESTDDTRVEVRLNRPLFKLGAWFEWPVGPAHAGIDGRVATVEQRRQLVSDGPFLCVSSSDRSIELSLALGAVAGSPGATSGATVRRIRELRFLHPRAMIGALVQGEVSMAAHVPRRSDRSPPVRCRRQDRTIHPAPDSHDRARRPEPGLEEPLTAPGPLAGDRSPRASRRDSAPSAS